MIIIGYQGIGKSTLARKNSKYIDLESTNFWIKGERDSVWYKVYCNIAIDLSKQGHIVFVSSHKDVQNELKARQTDELIRVCYPALYLHYEWVKKLHDRWQDTNSLKDKKAYDCAYNQYYENISDLMESPFGHILIENMNYDLDRLIQQSIHDAVEPSVNSDVEYSICDDAYERGIKEGREEAQATVFRLLDLADNQVNQVFSLESRIEVLQELCIETIKSRLDDYERLVSNRQWLNSLTITPSGDIIDTTSNIVGRVAWLDMRN